MSATTAAEMIYNVVDRLIDACYLEETFLSVVAVGVILSFLAFVALRHTKVNGHAEKHSSRRLDRFNIRAVVIMTGAAVIMLYTTMYTGTNSDIRPNREIFSDKDRPKGIPDLYNATIRELQRGLESKHYTSVDLVDVSYISKRLKY
jgi:hypothetical protein